MRLVAFLAFALFTAAILSPAMAADTVDPTNTYGSAVCEKGFICPERANDPAAIIAAATSCSSKYFGFVSNSDEMFSSSRGLDYNLCLTSKVSQKFGSSTIPVSPHCCVLKMADSELCELKCSVVSAPR
ncbi:MAG: hypothetical protein PHX43_04215 [Alphaproteobacteria bacterium]|nr:hypothetical protein [Alphaproteobacteria bacterium]